jgi:hypothetical protein
MATALGGHAWDVVHGKECGRLNREAGTTLLEGLEAFPDGRSRSDVLPNRGQDDLDVPDHPIRKQAGERGP